MVQATSRTARTSEPKWLLETKKKPEAYIYDGRIGSQAVWVGNTTDGIGRYGGKQIVRQLSSFDGHTDQIGRAQGKQVAKILSSIGHGNHRNEPEGARINTLLGLFTQRL